jgi:hypothetical protein
MRILSIAIPAVYVLLAIFRLSTAEASTVGAVMFIDTQERTMAYSFLAWVMALAIYLQILSSTVGYMDNGIRG